jgi:hypothetical protein
MESTLLKPYRNSQNLEDFAFVRLRYLRSFVVNSVPFVTSKD